MSGVDNPAYCGHDHERAGLVSNQDPDATTRDPDEPLHVVSCCSDVVCIAKMQLKVTTSTKQPAVFYSDADRRARRGQS